MSLLSETQKRCQSKFSASKSLAETKEHMLAIAFRFSTSFSPAEQNQTNNHHHHHSYHYEYNDYSWTSLSSVWITISCPRIKNNKRPMGHIAHLRKQFKSLNTYDYIITLIKRRKKNIIDFRRIYWFFIWTNLNPLHPQWWLLQMSEEFSSGSKYSKQTNKQSSKLSTKNVWTNGT